MEVKISLLVKALEIQGFKTFVDKVRLEFGPGITCIVGPNGSGKSNIVDALAWVLGEQSPRVLRGSHMEDVIFAGSERRRPVGMAEVTLILDNSEGALPLNYPEIAITRRLMRSGESEYRLNRVPCRLRDIQELFWDTGAGKERFAIIGQGRLDEILTVQPEERRIFLEEVAGISRYRWRKEQVLKRLAETEQNLVRLRDILKELELQWHPLKQEAERARRYRKLARVLKLVDLIQEVQRLHDLSEKREKVYRLKEEIRAALLRLEEEEKQLTRRMEEETRELEEGTVKKQQLQSYLQDLATRLERASGEKELVRQKWESLTDRSQEYGKELSSLIQEEDFVNKEKEAVRQRLETLAEEEKRLTEEADRLERVIIGEQSSKVDYSNELERLKEEGQRMEEDIFRLQSELTRLEERQGWEERYRSSWEEELQALSLKAGRLEKDMATWRHELEVLEPQLEALESEKHRLAGELLWQEKELKQLQSRIKSWEERRHAALANLRVWQQARQEREGFGEGVRLVLAAAEQGRLGTGVLGVVAEKIAVPPGLERAIEVALGSSAQNIIVRTARQAEEAIKFLKSARRGRATFLPLEWLHLRTPPAEAKRILREEGVLGIAAELVQYEEELRPAVQHLLGQTLVVAELSQALALAPRLRPPWRLVTLEGDLIQPQGPITGGTGYKRSSFFSQTLEIRRWERELEEADSGLNSSREEEGRLVSALEEGRRRLNRLEQESTALRHRIHQVLQKISEAAEEAQALREKMEAKKEEVNRLVSESRGAGQRKKLIEQELEALQVQKKSLEQDLNRVQGHLTALENVLLQYRQQLAAIRARLQALGAALAEARAGLASLERRGESLACRRKELEKSREEALQERHVLEEAYHSLKEKVGRLQEEYGRLQASLQELEEEHRKKQKGQKRLHARREAILREAASLQNSLQQEEVNLARLEAAIEHGYQQLDTTYGPDWRRLAARSYPHLARRAEQTKSKLAAELEKLGEVNQGAIEECARIEARLQELAAQIADLEGGRSALLKALQEIDTFMAQRLEATFCAVQEAFTDLFRELFGGGTAELVLTGEQDILRAGLEIMAQPPGKRTRHLALLSGGEKSLTALAFIFALLKVRPRAFCIFDEIDTALDEANVARFAGLLRSFARDTQFIVVSHRQGTMEAADALYGVTMEEEGVSRLVSVRMEQISA
ncbi:MAG: chromosome segregation protein SMC [Moorellaceae bacterium]